MNFETACERAREESFTHKCVQYVQRHIDGAFSISDWEDSATVASFSSGREIRNDIERPQHIGDRLSPRESVLFEFLQLFKEKIATSGPIKEMSYNVLAEDLTDTMMACLFAPIQHREKWEEARRAMFQDPDYQRAVAQTLEDLAKARAKYDR